MERNVLPPNSNSNQLQNLDNLGIAGHKNIDAPKQFGVQEIDIPSKDTRVVEIGGTIDLGQRLDPLDQLERYEKMRIRKHLTYSILSLSVAWILVGIIYFLCSGNSFLLVASSPISGPILIIMGYYFGDGLLQKHPNRGP